MEEEFGLKENHLKKAVIKEVVCYEHLVIFPKQSSCQASHLSQNQKNLEGRSLDYLEFTSMEMVSWVQKM